MDVWNLAPEHAHIYMQKYIYMYVTADYGW